MSSLEERIYHHVLSNLMSGIYVIDRRGDVQWGKTEGRENASTESTALYSEADKSDLGERVWSQIWKLAAKDYKSIPLVKALA